MLFKHGFLADGLRVEYKVVHSTLTGASETAVILVLLNIEQQENRTVLISMYSHDVLVMDFLKVVILYTVQIYRM